MGLMRGIRKNVKVIYWVVIIFVVVSFVFWGTIARPTRGGKYVGTVFDEKVSVKEFQLHKIPARRQAMIYAMRTRQPISLDLVESLMWERVVRLREADRWGIRVPMEEVTERIWNEFSRDGRFDEEAYQNYLYSMRLTEEELAQIFRDDIKLGELEKLVGGFVVVSPQELRERYDYDKQQRKIKFNVAEVDSLLPAFEVSTEAEQYYSAHKDEFREPRQVAVRYMTLEKASFLDEVTLSEEELRSYYEENKSAYTGADGNPAGFDEVKLQIERVLKARKADEMALEKATKLFTFSEATKMREVAEENGLSVRESGLIPETGAVAEGPGKDPAFRAAAFATAVGEVSPVIETELGYSVLTPVRLVPARTPPFEEVREAAAEKQREQRLREAAGGAGISAEEVETYVKEHSIIPPGLDVTYEEAFDYYEKNKSEFMRAKRVRVQYLIVEKEPFEKEVKLTEREIKREYRDNEWKYKDEKEKLKPLEEVREQIEKDLTSRKADEMARERAAELFTFYRPQRMIELSQKHGLELRETRLFSQGEEIDELLGKSPTFGYHAFQTELGHVSEPFSTEKGYCVLTPVQLVEAAVADFEEVAEEAARKAKHDKAVDLANKIAWERYREVRKAMTGGKDFETACKELGLEVQESDYFGRSDFSIEELGATGQDIQAMFRDEPNEVRLPRRTEESSFLYVVSEIKPPSDEEFEADKSSYYDKLAGEKAQQAFWEWRVALLKEANIKKNVPVTRKRASGRQSSTAPSRTR